MSRPRSLLDQLRRSWAFAWLAALVLGLAHLKDATEGYERMMVLLGYKPDALAIAATNEKGVFAREFSEVAWRRLFWARAIVGRIHHARPQDEVLEAYKAYVLASEVWATKMMTFVTYTDRFHGPAKAAELEMSVVSAMNNVSDQIVALRKAPAPGPAEIGAANAAIDAANAASFHFVRGFSPK